MSRMRPFYIACSYPALIASLLCSLSDYCDKKLERDTEYDNAVIANSSYIIEEILDVNLESCAQKCLTYRSACSAILHNRQMRSCKLLSARLNLQSISPGPRVEGWQYYTTPKGSEPSWVKYKTHHYFIDQRVVAWIEAKAECEARGSHLVEIETKEESDWLAQAFLLKDTCSSNIYLSCVAWTGGNDIAVEGRYQWSHSNMPINFTNWYSEPGPIPHEEDCIQLLRNGKWNDAICTVHKTQFICEKSDDS